MNDRLRPYIDFLLVVCAIAILVSIWRKKEAVPDESGELTKLLLQKLDEQRRGYEFQILKLTQDSQQLSKEIDSLKNLKQGVKLIYVEKIKRIDNLSSSEQAIEFQKIFQKNGISSK
jgi:hypothetical protein